MEVQPILKIISEIKSWFENYIGYPLSQTDINYMTDKLQQTANRITEEAHTIHPKFTDQEYTDIRNVELAASLMCDDRTTPDLRYMLKDFIVKKLSDLQNHAE